MTFADLFQDHRAAVEGGVTTHVTAGAHSGALAALRRGKASIGSALENDIVLIGDALDDRHFSLEIVNPWLGSVRVEPQDAGVRVNGRAIEVGRDVVARAPLSIQAGRAILELTPKLKLAAFRKPAAIAAACVGALVIGLPILQALTSITDIVTRPSDAPGFLTTGAVEPRAHVAALQERIRLAELAGAIAVDVGPAGAVVATGEVDDAGLARWRTVLQWNDGVAGAPLLLNNVTKLSDGLGSNIRSAWIDGDGELLLTNGQVVRVGGTLASGWRVTQIDASGIVLTKDKLNRRIEF